MQNEWGTEVGSITVTTPSTWSGNIDLYSPITIPSGATINISPGTSILLDLNASIIANGVLSASGTSASPITLADMENLRRGPFNWGKIVFSGSGANNSTLQYCNIDYPTDIEVTNTSNVAIENCSIMNSSSYGIDVTSSSNFLAQSDSIGNAGSQNPYHGIFITGGSNNNCYQNVIWKTDQDNSNAAGILYSGSSGNVGGNDVDWYQWGIAGIWGASPNSNWSNASVRNNRVADCGFGLLVYENSYCDFGESGPDVDGNNSIYGSSNYNADVGYTDPSVASGLYAEYNWWGSYPPNSALFTVGSGCYGYFNYPTSGDPWGSTGQPSTTEFTAASPLAYSAKKATDPSLPLQPAISFGPLQDSLLTGIGLKEKNSFTAAKNYFEAFVKTHPDNPAGYVELYGCADDTTLSDITNFFKALPTNAPAISQLLLGNLYQMENQPALAKQVNNTIALNYPNTTLEVKAEINKILIDLYDGNDLEGAETQLTVVKSQANLINPIELQDAEEAVALDGGPPATPIAASQRMISASSRSVNTPKSFDLSQNYPNPFNPTTTINYQLPKDAHVTLKVYDILGREVATLVDGEQSAGYHEVSFDGSNFASGVYFYKMTAGNYTAVKKLMLLK